MSASNSKIVTISALTADNYPQWRSLQVTALKFLDVYDHVESKESAAPPVDATQLQLREWQRKDDLALAQIKLNISTNQLYNTGDQKQPISAYEVWETLRRVYTDTSMAAKMGLQGQLSSFSFPTDGSKSVQDHSNALREIADRLEACGDPVSEANLCMRLLLSMPPEYSDVVNQFKWTPGAATTLKYGIVLQGLLAKETELKATRAEVSRAEMTVRAHLAATLALRRAQVESTGRKWVECSYCHKQGHIADNCWQQYPEKRTKRKGKRARDSNLADEDPAQEARPAPQSNKDPSTNGRTSTSSTMPKTRVLTINIRQGVSDGTNRPAALNMRTSEQDPDSRVDKTSERTEWYLDSGASRHVCGHRNRMTNYKPMTPLAVVGANNQALFAQGVGDIHAWLSPATAQASPMIPVTLCDVLYVPGISCNLLAVTPLVKAGYRVVFEGNAALLQDGSTHLTWGEVRLLASEGLFHVFTIPRMETTATVGALRLTTTTERGRLWHDRLGHLNAQQMEQLHSGRLIDSKVDNEFSCDSCQAGKSHRAAMPTAATHRSTRPLQLVHSDICGPINVQSLGGVRYLLTFVDDFSRYIAIYLTQGRTGRDVLDCFRDYKTWAETTTGNTVVALRTDGAAEYVHGVFNDFIVEHGITRQVTPAYTPQHNGVAERVNRTIFNGIRCMLHRAGLSTFLWPEAARTAVFIRNRCPSRSIDRGRTPQELWTGDKPSLDLLRVFGCIAHVHVPKERRGNKLSDRSIQCIHVGYSLESKAYRLYDPASKKIIISRDVTFEEQRFVTAGTPLSRGVIGEGEQSTSQPQDADALARPDAQLCETGAAATIEIIGHKDNLEAKDGHADLQPAEDNMDDGEDPLDLLPLSHLLPNYGQPAVGPAAPQLPASEPAVQPPVQPIVGQRRSVRGGPGGHASSRSRDAQARQQAVGALYAAVGAAVQAVEDEPNSYEDAMRRDDRQLWHAAMVSEVDSIQRNGTWELIELPEGRQAIGCKWVFKIKRKADGSIDRYKARLVAKGYSQQAGIDYHETFAPVAKFTSIRLLLALAAHYDYEVHQMDVRTAFLNGDLDVDIYMRQPDGFVEPGHGHLVCHLKKSLYGLKQAGRAWYHKIHAALVALQFSPLVSDTCVYVRRTDGHVIFVALYVDDLLLVTDSLPLLATLKHDLSNRFEMTDLGEVQYILGLQVTRDRLRRTLTLSQAEYVRRLLERYGMLNSRPTDTPIATGTRLSQDDCPTVPVVPVPSMQGHSYAAIVGGLMYAMLGTRPDLAFAVASLSRFTSNPGEPHMQALKRVLRYLHGTVNHQLMYDGREGNKGHPSNTSGTLLGYCDADWAASMDDRRSVTGWVFLVAGGAISWQSQRQKSVALSTVEAEYMAASNATKEAVWLRTLLNELGETQSNATTILTDNQGSIALAKNPEQHQRSKHIDIRYHFIRERIADGVVRLEYVPGTEMVADHLTKPLAKDAHNLCARRMGLCW
jgi:transposase InsO family protein